MQNTLRTLFYQHERKVRFVIVGGINTLVGLSIYPTLYIVLKPIGFSYLEVLFLAQVICITFAFFNYKYFVYKTRGGIKKEYIKFFMFYGFFFILNLFFLPLMVEVININPIISQTFFSLFVTATSYFWHTLITFKNVK